MSAAQTPEAGHFYTMGKLKHPCGDRSYLHTIWEVIATNATHAIIKDPAQYKHSFGREPLVVCIAEFDWTPADELFAALAEHAAPDAISKATGAA